MQRTRRRFLRAGLLASVGLAGCASPVGNASPTESLEGPTATRQNATVTGTPTRQDRTATATPTGVGSTADGSLELDTVGLVPVAEGFTSPLAFADPPGEHRYVADQAGQIYVLGESRSEPFLDVTDWMVSVSGYSERGLLGMAFHPEYPDDRRVFVRYSAPRREGTPEGYSHTFVLSAFDVREDGLTTVPDSERTLLEIPEPQSNHNAGPIAFGPDGHLFVTVGDGGGANDTGIGHVADWYASNDGGNGQDVAANLLGSLLRIDVDDTSGDRPYGIPDDNPLVDAEGLDEHYAWGLRNPWGLSIDGADVFVADVGQNRYEEVNLIRKGGNYGWNVREGPNCFQAVDCPTVDDRGEAFESPICWYGHDDPEPSGVAVVGGHVYRGSAIPELRGRYVFGDWQAGGKLFVASPSEDERWPIDVVDAEPADSLRSLLGTGRDRDGELYVLTSEHGTVAGETGAVHRLVSTG